MKIVLASSSPRRLNLLLKEGFHIEVVHPAVDESRVGDESPPEYISRLAQKKANHVATENSLTVGADTVVVLNNEFLNKPTSVSEAKMTLAKLSGNTHTVYTGLSLVCSECGRTDSGFDKTIVHFNVLTESAIIRYIETGEPMDKAGAYGIQGMGSFLVKRIEGELDTVVGFPMKLFKKMIEVHRKCLGKV